jgi:hypothetical protein
MYVYERKGWMSSVCGHKIWRQATHATRLCNVMVIGEPEHLDGVWLAPGHKYSETQAAAIICRSSTPAASWCHGTEAKKDHRL